MTLIIHKLKTVKINLFDILVLSILLLIGVGLLYLRFSKKTQWISVRVTVANDDWSWEGQPPQYWYIDSLKSGSMAYSSFGEKIAEITNVESFDIGGYRRRAYIDLNLKGSYDSKRKIYLYNFQPLQVGKPIDLTFGKNNIHGLVTYIEEGSAQYKQKRIEIKVLKVRPWIAESYIKGLEMKDSEGRVLARIDDVKRQPASSYEFSDLRGQMIQVTNPDYQDVTIDLTIKTFMSGGVEHFIDRAAIKVGEKIWFQFPGTVIRDAEITNIFE